MIFDNSLTTKQVYLKLAKSMMDNHRTRTLEQRTSYIGTPIALLAGSSARFGLTPDKPRDNMSSIGRAGFFRAVNISRMACGLMMATNAADRYRTDFIEDHEFIDQFRDSLAYKISPHVLPCKIPLSPGAASLVDIDYYFYPDCINLHYKPAYCLADISGEELSNLVVFEEPAKKTRTGQLTLSSVVAGTQSADWAKLDDGKLNPRIAKALETLVMVCFAFHKAFMASHSCVIGGKGEHLYEGEDSRLEGGR